MTRIIDHTGQAVERITTIADIRALKTTNRQLAQVTAGTAAEAAAAEKAGIEMEVCTAGAVRDVRRASAQSPNDLLGSLEAVDWEALAEAPPGHITVSAVTHHALWDSWIHERDVLLPLGG